MRLCQTYFSKGKITLSIQDYELFVSNLGTTIQIQNVMVYNKGQDLV